MLRWGLPLGLLLVLICAVALLLLADGPSLDSSTPVPLGPPAPDPPTATDRRAATVDAAPEPLTPRLATSTILVEVVDSTGRLAPCANVTCRWSVPRSTIGEELPLGTSCRAVDERGVATFPDLEQGLYRLKAAADGFTEASAEVDVSPGSIGVHRITLEVQAAARLSVQCLDAAGGPLASRRVSVAQIGGSLGGPAQALTDSDGWARFAHLPPGDAIVFAMDQSVSAVLEAGVHQVLQVHRQAAAETTTVEGLLLKHGAPATDVIVELWSDAESGQVRRWAHEMTDSSGAFSLELPSELGSCTLRAHPDGNWSEGSATLITALPLPAPPVRLEVPWTWLTVAVEDEIGRRLADQPLVLHQGKRAVRHLSTNDEGVAAFGWVPFGDYELESRFDCDLPRPCRGPGCVNGRLPLSVSPDQGRSEALLVLEPAGRIEVRIETGPELPLDRTVMVTLEREDSPAREVLTLPADGSWHSSADVPPGHWVLTARPVARSPEWRARVLVEPGRTQRVSLGPPP